MRHRKNVTDAGRATITRAKSMPVADRKWRIKILAALALIFAELTIVGVIQYAATINNRGVGHGNRAVDCAIVRRVAPELNLAECAATPKGH